MFAFRFESPVAHVGKRHSVPLLQIASFTGIAA
jgi:hypothetical protein